MDAKEMNITIYRAIASKANERWDVFGKGTGRTKEG